MPAFYYNTRITLAERPERPRARVADLGHQPVERRVQHDGERPVLDRREWTGRPAERTDRPRHAEQQPFRERRALPTAGNIVDESAQIGRTREAIVGMQHELMSNFAVVDFIYRKYDRGTTTYTIGYEPGAGYDALRAIYQPATYTDPVTGRAAPTTSSATAARVRGSATSP